MKIIYFFTLSLMMCYAFANSTLAAVELFEPFDSDILCPKPEGWTVINHSTGCNWIFGSNWENSTGERTALLLQTVTHPAQLGPLTHLLLRLLLIAHL